MKLENWSINFSAGDPYTAPEQLACHASGQVYGNPKFEDGTVVSTSRIVDVSDSGVTTKSGSFYELGEPHPDYEAAYPTAKQRVLAMKVTKH